MNYYDTTFQNLIAKDVFFVTIKLRKIQHKDAEAFWNMAFSNEDAEWTKGNGPYFQEELPTKSSFIAGRVGADYMNNPLKKIILLNNRMVGMVSAHYEDGNLQKWLEAGIVIYNQSNWQQHIGFQAFSLWIDELFEKTDLPHIGLTTWAGNQRMLGLAEKMGLKKEAEIRQVRYWNGQYWDSIKYGVLRDEWEKGDRSQISHLK
ncbi:acetyltransferase [Liquorilactobacillus aquaticus DSM 21051]|uniref:Acetyltransferase n=1 Tax=Liquorilactobacillus aquaticus DSM 21051 TaxID=1423725 RepID=A0A0R2CYP0_9LACO|nr:acetyltransferase [Liquorilactobacillus aquaticus DSM 21051]